jgi:hypothetical protein
MLGLHFTTTINQSVRTNWSAVTGRIRTIARDACYTELSLDRRVLCVHNYLLATAWFTEQVLPIPEDSTRQINTIIAWHLWRGEIFRKPLYKLQQNKRHGECGLLNVAPKGRALFAYCLQAQSSHTGSMTAEWLSKWKLVPPYNNLQQCNKNSGMSRLLTPL